MLKLWRVFSGPLWTAKCLAQAISLWYLLELSPWSAFTTLIPIRPFMYGSSPYDSCPRPHLGSRKMLIVGVQKDNPLYLATVPFFLASAFLARASSLTAVNTLLISESLNDAAIPMQEGKTVARPFLPTPCRASLHQSNDGMPNRSMAGELFIIRLTFSSNVRREHMSFARSDEGRFGSWKGYVWDIPDNGISKSKKV